jgi:hypothetical protein
VDNAGGLGFCFPVGVFDHCEHSGVQILFQRKKGSRNKLVLAMGMLADIFGFASSVHSISIEGDETDIILICSVVFSAILWVFPHVSK